MTDFETVLLCVLGFMIGVMVVSLNTYKDR